MNAFEELEHWHMRTVMLLELARKKPKLTLLGFRFKDATLALSRAASAMLDVARSAREIEKAMRRFDK